jgi:AcrR family transcriptional regulator
MTENKPTRATGTAEPRKGELTRDAIVDRALDLATRLGLEGLTIGALADDLGLSKSGLFAHFGSKQALQIAVIDAAIQKFVNVVVTPALRCKRGEPRVRALFERWFDWVRPSMAEAGCFFVAASVEFDDRPGIVRDRLATAQRDWLGTLAQAARIAVDQGHFRADLDAPQFAFEGYGIALAYHHVARLLDDKDAEARARTAFESLIERARSARAA